MQITYTSLTLSLGESNVVLEGYVHVGVSLYNFVWVLNLFWSEGCSNTVWMHCLLPQHVLAIIPLIGVCRLHTLS